MCCVIKNYNSMCISFYALSFGEKRKSYVTEADSSINQSFPCVHICTHVYVGKHMGGHICPCVCMCLWSMLSVFLGLHLIFWDKASHWTSNPVIGQSGWLSNSRAPPTSVSPVLGCLTQLFVWVLGILIQAFILVWQTLYWLGHPSDPCLSILIVCYWGQGPLTDCI